MHADQRNKKGLDEKRVGSNKYAGRNSDSREIQGQSGPVYKRDASLEEAIPVAYSIQYIYYIYTK